MENYRRGCFGQFEYRKRRREWSDHWIRADTKPVSRSGIELRITERVKSYSIMIEFFPWHFANDVKTAHEKRSSSAGNEAKGTAVVA